METDDPWYYTRRAESLAVVLLTRRADVVVHKANADYGPDLIVSFTQEMGEPPRRADTGKMFGVVLKAFVGTGRVRPEGEQRIQLAARMLEQFAHSPYPVCLFAFELTSDRGYYAWLREPSIAEGRTELRENDRIPLIHARNLSVSLRSETLSILDEAALARIADQVLSWYGGR